MQTLLLLVIQNKLVALVLLLVALLLILFAVKRKKVKKNTLEVPKTKTEITENFKKLVGDIDLNLGTYDLSAEALIEIEETLLALKELYEKKYISEEVYLNRTEMVMQSLNTTNAP